jgi:hypothetical protein
MWSERSPFLHGLCCWNVLSKRRVLSVLRGWTIFCSRLDNMCELLCWTIFGGKLDNMCELLCWHVFQRGLVLSALRGW